MTTTTFGGLEVADHFDTDADLEFTLNYVSTWLSIAEIESLILHLQNALTSKKSDHEQTN